MEARRFDLLLLVVIGAAFSSPHAFSQSAFQTTTTNFIVYGPDARLTQAVAQKAEEYRKQLAVKWLGRELPNWHERCPIRVQIAMHAGGETSFAFLSPGGGKGTPTSWSMKIFGPPDRLLDAVLPHEVTHTIFATYFGRPLPRWADEGACTTVEHESERKKNHQMLLDFLTAKPSRGIPFNRMFTMKEYPHDILPLYAQGYSLAKFLIMKRGHRHFIDYIEAGLNHERPGRETQCWNRVTEQFYGIPNLSELQLDWIAWVRNGSRIEPTPQAIAANQDTSVKQAILLTENQKNSDAGRQTTMQAVARQPAPSSIEDSWYAKQSGRVATNRQSLEPDDKKTIWR